MATRILHKRNSTANTPPLAGDLAAGELAFNTADGKLYLKRDDNTIIDVSQSIFQRDTSFTVVDDGVSPGTITADVDGVQKLQINGGGIVVDGSIDINSSETLFFNDADNNAYVGVSAPDTVDYTYVMKLPNTLPIDKSILSIRNDGTTTWDEVNPFDARTIYVSEEYGDDTNDGIHDPVKTVKRGAQLAAALGQVPAVDPGEGYYNAKRLIDDNLNFLIEETIGYVDTTYPVLSYDENLWRRYLQISIEAVLFDIILGGNSKAVDAGEDANAAITNQTEFVDALAHLRDISVNVINNQDPATSYQALYTQVKLLQISGNAAQADVIAEYDIIRDIITNDVSPAVVEADFTTVPAKIELAVGEFVVDNPVILGDKVSIQGSSSRGVVLRPANANVDMFRCRDSSGVINVTMRDGLDGNGDPSYTFDWAIGFDDPTDPAVDRLGYFGLPDTVPEIAVPPLVQNMLIVSFLGANGLNVDGNKVTRPTAYPAPEVQRLIMRGNGFAISTFGGIGVLASNNGYAQLTTCAFSFCTEGLYARSGGYIEVTNSGTSFGIYGLRSSGFRSDALLDDRGVVATTGLIAGDQFMRILGTKRFPLEEYVIRIRDINTTADITSSFKTGATVVSFDASTAPDAGTDVFTIVGHGFNNGDAVDYDANGNTVIPGLVDTNTYFVEVLTTDTFKLYSDEGLTFAVDITSTSTGTHEFVLDAEEFFIQSRQDLHKEYQILTTEAGSFAFQPGDLILGTTGGQTNTAYVYSYDDGTDTLIVSNEETNGTRVLFDNTSTITDIAGSPVSIAVATATATDEYRTATIIVDSTVPASEMQTISNAEGQEIRLHRPSTVNASSHVWEYSGAGTDFNALDETLCCSIGTEFNYREDLPGRVYSAGSDERGDFRVNGIMRAEARSGKVIFNNIVEAEDVSVVQLTIDSVSINEISTDTDLGDNEPGGAQNSRISTQRAIRTFMSERLGDVLDKEVSSTAVPRALVQLNAQGQINTDLLPPGRGISTFPVDGFEERLNLSNEIPAISVNTGDQVAETYDQQILQLTGAVTVAKGSEIIQQNTGATGYAKEDVNSGTTLTLVGPFTGTFNTTDVLEDDTVSLGANSVPTSVGSVDTITDNYFLSTDTESQFLRLDPNDTYDFTGVTVVSSATNEAEGTITSGPTTGVVGALDNGTLVGGSGYTPGSGSATYEFVSLTGGTGTGAIADITVTDGAVSSVNMRRGGSGYVIGDTLSATNTDIGGTGSGFSIDVDSVQTRLYVDLTGNNIKFAATPTTPDYIEDANSPETTITNLADSTQYTFNAEDTGSGGDVDYATSQITITGHGYTNGDTSVYDDNTNGDIGNLTGGTTYWVKVIDANTIELYTDYNLGSGAKVLFGAQSTGVHNLTRYVVDVNTSTFYVPAHGYNTGDAVRITGADLPDPIVSDEHFFVGSVTTDGFTLHDIRADALASISGATIEEQSVTDTGTGSATLTANDVRIFSVVNTSSTNADNWNIISQQTIDASNVVSGILSPARLGTGTASDETFLRGDNTWQVAVQSITTPEPSPLNISGSFFDDAGTDRYYDTLTLSIDQVEAGAGPTFSTKGVASFNKNQFTVSAGQVSVTSGVINAGTLDGNDGSYYLDPLNLSATVPVSKGGTGLTTYTQGDILISGAANSLTQLLIGATNSILVSNGSQPSWSTSPTIGGTLTVTGAIVNNSTTESTSNSTGAIRTLGGIGVAKNANIGGSLDVDGSITSALAVSVTSVPGTDWAFKGASTASNQSGIWFSADNGQLLLRDAGGNLTTRINSNGGSIIEGSTTINGALSATSFSGDGASVTNVNAVTLDSLDSTQFLRSDANDTYTGSVLTINNSLDMVGEIRHSGDADTYLQFNAADTWRVVTGASQRLSVTNSGVTVSNGDLTIGTGAINAYGNTINFITGTDASIVVDDGNPTQGDYSAGSNFVFSGDGVTENGRLVANLVQTQNVATYQTQYENAARTEGCRVEYNEGSKSLDYNFF